MINLINSRTSLSGVVLFFVLLGSFHSLGQNQTNCPSIPAFNYLDTNCFMPIDGELHLGQGTVDFTRDESSCSVSPANTIDFYYPCNRPTWPIAVAHTWQLMRNILKHDWYNINSFGAILLKETTGGSCDDGLDYSCYPGLVYPISGNATYQNDACDQSSCGCIACSDGCYQMSRGDGGWATLNAYYPTRYPDYTTMEPWIEGGAAFETATLSRMYYDLAFIRGVQFAQGLDPMPVVDATNDPYGAIYLSARAYNEGFGAGASYSQNVFNGAGNRAAAIASNDWSTIIGPFGYADKVVHFNQVLDNNYTPCDASDPRGWHNWYDSDVAWVTIDEYMEKIFLMYTNELTVADRNAIKARVQAVYDQADVNNNGAVSFRYEMGPVIDALALNIPYDDPTSLIINSNDGDKGCKSGWCTGPLVSITPMGPTTVCEGLSVELVTIEGTGFTYQWTKDDAIYANSNSEQHILFVTESGSYSVFVTDDQGCTIAACCPIEVIIEDCSSCDMTVAVSGTPNSCTGVADGTVEVTSVSGVTGPFSYNWSGQASGSGQVFSNVEEGTYYVEVIQNSDPTCLGYASIKIDETDLLYQSLELSKVVIDCDEATLTADIIDNPPSSCDVNFLVEFTGGSCYGSWDKFTYSLVVKVDGVPVGPFEPRGQGGNDCNHLDVTLTVPDGGVVSAGVFNNGNGGPSNFDFVLNDSEGGNIFTESTGNHTFPQGAETMIVDGTVSCATTPPDYTFTWSPSGGITVNSSNGQQEVVNANTATTTTFTVQATSVSHNCVLEESVDVIYSCGGCSAPASATITPQGSTTICSGSSVTLEANNVPGYTYSWYLNGTLINGESGQSIVASQAGSYVVRIADPADPTNASCYLESSPLTVSVLNATTPSISISADQNPICPGQTVNFSIDSQSGEGSSPSYDWKVDNSSTGDIGTTFSSSSLSDGQVVTLELTSSEACANPAVVTSPGVTMTVTNSILPTIVIVADQNPICSGQTVTFTIDSQSGEGVSPGYDWKVNNTSTGDVGVSFSSSSLVNGDVVSLELTSDDACANPVVVESEEIAMTVNSSVAPTISIQADQVSICPGQTINFAISSQSGEGTTPSYNWLVNGSAVSETGLTFSSNSLNDGDVVSLELTSSSACASPTIVESTGVPITVSSTVSPSVDIIPTTPTTICTGDNVVVELDALVGGDGNETYDWLLNGSSSGQTSSTFTSNSLNDQDEISLLVSNLSSCSSSPTVESIAIVINVGAPVTPQISIVVDENPICEGETATFSIDSQSNEGGSPSYEWYVDGLTTSQTGSTFSSNSLNNGELVSVEMTVVETCVTAQTATSNEITMVINDPDVPTVSISSTATSICSGDNVVFEIDQILNQGPTPSYDWLLNGTSTGVTADSYASNSLSNGDQVSLTMTSSASCVDPQVVTSSAISITVVSSITPTVTIAASTPIEICPNDEVILVIDGLQGGGSSPTYEWFLNSATTNVTTDTYNSSSLTDSDQIYVVVSNLSSCANQPTATSNSIEITETSPVTPEVSMTISDNPSCENDVVTFNVSNPVNSGASPQYEWFVNGTGSGETGTTYQSSVLNNGDNIFVQMTVAESCVTENPVQSNTESLIINEPLVPSVEIEADQTTICSGESITFSISTQSNQGTGPTYQWFINDNPVSAGVELIRSGFSDGDKVTLELSVAENCVTNEKVVSNEIEVSVVEPVNPVVVINEVEEGICEDEMLSLSTSLLNGSSVDYEWAIDNDIQSTTSDNIVLSNLEDGSIIKVKVTSTLSCDNGASDEAIYTVSIITTPTPLLSPVNDTVVCESPGLTLELSSTEGGTIEWMKDNSSIAASSTVLNLTTANESGEYQAGVSIGDCPRVLSNSVLVTINSLPVLDVPSVVSVDKGATVEINASTSIGAVLWSPSTMLSSVDDITPTFLGSEEAGEFIYTILVENGTCSATGQLVISVFEELDIPTSFTPNGDGTNEVWNIPGSNKYPNSSLRIFNRWGQEVYSQLNGYNEPWSGELNGKLLPVGTYYYILDLGAPNDPRSLNGTVTIVR